MRRCHSGALIRLSTLLVLFVLPAFAVLAHGGDLVNSTPSGVAIHGYDPVAYFTMAAATPGQEAIVHTYNGARWFFANEEHRAMFADDPERYAPAYGGYCAFAVSRGGLADIDPEAWLIEDGTLYLNLSRSVQRRFRNNLAQNIRFANENWPALGHRQ